MTTANQPPVAPGPLSPGWSLTLGILLVIAGIIALIHPGMTAVLAAVYVGWFALVSGVIAIVVAIRTRSEPHFGWRFAVGLLYLGLGFLLVSNPIAAAASLAILVGAFILASGVVEIMLAFRLKPKSGWGWLLANGIVSIVFAIMIVAGWPMGSLILIGYLVGFQIITCGVARIALAMAARKAAPVAA